MRVRTHRITKSKLVWAGLILLLAVLVILPLTATAQGLVEYALILVLVAVVVIVVLTILGPAIGKVFCAILGSLSVTGEEMVIDLGGIMPNPEAPMITQFYQPYEPTLAAVTSNTPGARLADNFSGLSEPIAKVVWWGTHGINGDYCSKSSNTFILEFYQEGEIPGALVQQVVSEPVIAAERDLLDANGDPLAKLYRYVATLPNAIPLTSGWLSIQSTGDEECLFSWSVASTTDSHSAWENPPFGNVQNSTACIECGGEKLPRKFGKACYVDDSAAMTFDEHEDAAQNIHPDYHLASIHSNAEKNFVRDLVDGDMWIGLTDRDVEGTFVNLDGTPLDYEFWGEGQPDDLGGQDGVIMVANGVWIDESLNTQATAVYKAGYTGWVANDRYDYSFGLIGNGASPGQELQVKTGAPDQAMANGNVDGAPAPLERDNISDIAQAVWLMKIVNGSSLLYPPDQAKVIGRPGGGGFLGNEAILKDPLFVASLAAAFEDTYFALPMVAEAAANAILDLLVYSISIDHLFWIERYKGTELEPLFDSIDAVNTLNSDAGMVLGGQADADHDGVTNSEEWSTAIASGQFEEILVNLFISSAERFELVFEGGFEDTILFPDLTAIEATASKMTLATSQMFTVSASARNNGQAASDASTLRFLLTDATYVTPDDIELGSVPVPGLAPGQSSAQDLLVSAPASVGLYWVGACAELLPDDSFSYNQCSSAVPIEVIGSDLTLTNPGVNNNSLPPSGTFTISATATNLSVVPSPASSTRYYLSSDSTIDTSDSLLGTSSIPALAAGASAAQSLPTATAPTVSGDYWVGACAELIPDETNTGNQCTSGVAIHVLGPDLAVGNPGVSKATLQPSEAFTISATATNLSVVSATDTTLRFYVSFDSTITTGDSPLTSSAIPALAGGASAVRNLPANAPATSGFYWVGACVDSVANELITNNQCSAGVPIEVTRPDLTVINPSVVPGVVFTNASFVVNATAKNQGAAASGPSTMTYYISADLTIDTGDVPRDTDNVGGLAPGGESVQNTSITAPSTPGTYYMGACMAVVANESETGNQCSLGAILIVVP